MANPRQLAELMAETASEGAKVAMTCLECGTAIDFKGSPNIREAMIQIDEFRREHGGCKDG